MAFETIPHGTFPFDESPWIKHFRDADDANQRAQIHAANYADSSGHDALARHIMGTQAGDNPFAAYKGPFFEGMPGRQFSPDLPNQLYSEYFNQFAFPGGQPGQGPFADPRRYTIPGAAGPAVTGPAYRERNTASGFGDLPYPFGSAYGVRNP